VAYANIDKRVVRCPPTRSLSQMPDEVKNIQGAIAPDSEERKSFIKGLVDNGQAAKPLPDGSLPPGATHEIIGEAANGLPIIRRRRFSAH
jgi:hypothetical protein